MGSGRNRHRGQGRQDHYARRAQHGGGEAAQGLGGEARLPGRGQQDDEACYQLPLQEQGGLPKRAHLQCFRRSGQDQFPLAHCTDKSILYATEEHSIKIRVDKENKVL